MSLKRGGASGGCTGFWHRGPNVLAASWDGNEKKESEQQFASLHTCQVFPQCTSGDRGRLPLWLLSYRTRLHSCRWLWSFGNGEGGAVHWSHLHGQWCVIRCVMWCTCGPKCIGSVAAKGDCDHHSWDLCGDSYNPSLTNAPYYHFP